MAIYKNPYTIGDFWGISNVNKAASTDHNRLMPFKFIIDGDQTVTYDGCFDSTRCTYSDRYSNKLNAVEENSYLCITDLRKVIRDHPQITVKQLNRMIYRLQYICHQALLSGLVDLHGYILNATTTKVMPEVISIPEFPEEPDDDKDKKDAGSIESLLRIGSIFVTDNTIDC